MSTYSMKMDWHDGQWWVSRGEMSAYSTKMDWHDGQWWVSRGEVSAYSTKTDWHEGQWWASLAKDGQGGSFDELGELGPMQKAVGAVISEWADAASPESLTAQPE